MPKTNFFEVNKVIKHIIFDFDGTVADSIDLALKVGNEIAKKHNFNQLTMDGFREMNNYPIKERSKKMGIPLYRLPALSVEFLFRYRQLIHSLKVFDGIKDVIMELSKEGYYLSIVSSNSVENIKFFLKNNQLEVFNNIISSNNLFGKNQSISKYMRKYKISPDELIYIGDELRDIEACKKTSVKIISVVWGFDSLELLKSGNPDCIAKNPEDILSAINKFKD